MEVPDLMRGVFEVRSGVVSRVFVGTYPVYLIFELPVLPLDG